MLRFAYFSLFVLLILGGCQSSWAPPTEPCSLSPVFNINSEHPKADKIQRIMDRYVAQGIPGVIVLVDDEDGMWVGSAGYADLEQGLAMQTCHLNKLGSVTKMMMGSLVWDLVQEGLLDIEAPISQYIPEISTQLPFGDQIKLYMLLNHSSGVYDIARDLEYNLAILNDMTHVWTEEEVLTFLEGKSATHEPGTAIRYSNTNTLLEGLIIEAVTGRPHAEVLQERIFDRLGMGETAYYNYDGDFPFGQLAQGYLDFNNDEGSIQNISALNPGNGNGFTGVYGTVTDMFLFADALLREQSLIEPENLALIYETLGNNEESDPWQTSWGGIHSEYRNDLPEGILALGHAGGDIGYSSCLNYFPHNETVFAATFNYGGNLPSPLLSVLRDLRRELVLAMAE